VDVRGRSQQVSGVMLQDGGVSLCLRDEEARIPEDPELAVAPMT
jgi:hypothetical protein